MSPINSGTAPSACTASEMRVPGSGVRIRATKLDMSQTTEKIWYNGKFIPWNDAKIHVLSHVVSYGSSVFEGIRCCLTDRGPAIFRAAEHMRRLLDSAKIYRMDVPFTIDQL